MLKQKTLHALNMKQLTFCKLLREDHVKSWPRTLPRGSRTAAAALYEDAAGRQVFAHTLCQFAYCYRNNNKSITNRIC